MHRRNRRNLKRAAKRLECSYRERHLGDYFNPWAVAFSRETDSLLLRVQIEESHILREGDTRLDWSMPGRWPTRPKRESAQWDADISLKESATHAEFIEAVRALAALWLVSLDWKIEVMVRTEGRSPDRFYIGSRSVADLTHRDLWWFNAWCEDTIFADEAFDWELRTTRIKHFEEHQPDRLRELFADWAGYFDEDELRDDDVGRLIDEAFGDTRMTDYCFPGVTVRASLERDGSPRELATTEEIVNWTVGLVACIAESFGDVADVEQDPMGWESD